MTQLPHTVEMAAVDLYLAYRGTTVVREASISLAGGAVTALAGPNRSGKSTLSRALARLHRPDRGDVVLDGNSPAVQLSAKQFARRVTLLAQSRPTPTGVSVRDVAQYGRHSYRGRWRARIRTGPGR